MNDATVTHLNQINREFYRTTADSFDQSRSDPWPGWELLLPYIQPPLTVLDVGCGNGRFGVFLAQKLGTKLTYYGIDSNSTLIERAQAALAGTNAYFDIRDVVEHPLDTGTYDFVALFGMLHHIPGRQRRCDFMQVLAERVAPGGWFAFATWRFYEYARFRDRIVPWPAGLDVEPGDYLLDWRRDVRALRYCHYVDDAEHADLVAAAGLAEVATYRADGRTNDMNCYSVLHREVS